MRPMLERKPWATSAGDSESRRYSVTTSSGGFWRSASMKHAYGPRAAESPLRQLSVMPAVRRVPHADHRVTETFAELLDCVPRSVGAPVVDEHELRADPGFVGRGEQPVGEHRDVHLLVEAWCDDAERVASQPRDVSHDSQTRRSPSSTAVVAVQPSGLVGQRWCRPLGSFPRSSPPGTKPARDHDPRHRASCGSGRRPRRLARSRRCTRRRRARRSSEYEERVDNIVDVHVVERLLAVSEDDGALVAAQSFEVRGG